MPRLGSSAGIQRTTPEEGAPLREVPPLAGGMHELAREADSFLELRRIAALLEDFPERRLGR